MKILDTVRRIWSASDERTPGSGDDFWYGPVGTRTGTGLVITPSVALKTSNVAACLNKIAKSISTLPLQVMRVDTDGTMTRDATHPLAEIIGHAPNANDSAVDMWHFLCFSALLRGTAYAEIAWGRDGAVESLTPLSTPHVRPEQLPNGRWRFEYREPRTAVARVILQDDMFRFSGLTPNGIEGLGLTDVADETVALMLAADQYAARVFQNSIAANLILYHPGKLNEEAKNRFLASLRDRLAGVANSHKPLLLQDGIKAERLAQNAQEAQLLESRRWQLAELCRVFDIPLSIMGLEEAGSARASVEEHSLNFQRFCLAPFAHKIEASIRRDLIVPDAQGRRTHVARFDFSELLRGNSQARADLNTKSLGSGGSPAWKSVNEVRADEGLPPLAGDQYDLPAVGTNPISPSKE